MTTIGTGPRTVTGHYDVGATPVGEVATPETAPAADDQLGAGRAPGAQHMPPPPQPVLTAPAHRRGGGVPDPDEDYEGYLWVGTRQARGDLFAGGIEALDVHQGGLGSCYLLADLASMAATDPALIRQLVREDDDGNFAVTFHQRGDGAPIEVVVDRDLVWGLGAGGIGFQNASPRGDDGAELWVAIVEKAYAQLHGGYEAINGGWMSPTFEELTGRDFRSYYEPSADRAWDLLSARTATSADERAVPWESRLTSPAAASTAWVDHGSDTLWEKLAAVWHSLLQFLGLAEGYAESHAYAILGVGEDAERGQYVIMYNPWGRYEGQRDGHNDGLFRVSLEEFTRAYEDIVVSSDVWTAS